MKKTELFFNLLTVVYGSDALSRKWPTPLELQAAKKIFGETIEKYSESELKYAIDLARKKQQDGDKDFIYGAPKIDLILGLVNKPACAAHREYLPPPEPKKAPEQHVQRCLAEMRMA